MVDPICVCDSNAGRHGRGYRQRCGAHRCGNCQVTRHSHRGHRYDALLVRGKTPDDAGRRHRVQLSHLCPHPPPTPRPRPLSSPITGSRKRVRPTKKLRPRVPAYIDLHVHTLTHIDVALAHAGNGCHNAVAGRGRYAHRDS